MAVVRGLDPLRDALAAPPPAGPTAARARFRREALELARREGLADAAFAFEVVALEDVPGPRLRAGGETLDAGRLVPPSGTLTALACGVCTIGPALERRVAALFAERRVSLAVALDSLGNELLMTVSRRLQDRIQAEVRRRGLTMAGELRPGDPGLGLDAQPAVLRLAGAAGIGIGTTPGLALDPHKSASMVLGVGVDLPPARWSRCDDCPTRPRCAMARERPGSGLMPEARQ